MAILWGFNKSKKAQLARIRMPTLAPPKQVRHVLDTRKLPSSITANLPYNRTTCCSCISVGMNCVIEKNPPALVVLERTSSLMISTKPGGLDVRSNCARSELELPPTEPVAAIACTLGPQLAMLSPPKQGCSAYVRSNPGESLEDVHIQGHK